MVCCSFRNGTAKVLRLARDWYLRFKNMGDAGSCLYLYRQMANSPDPTSQRSDRISNGERSERNKLKRCDLALILIISSNCTAFMQTVTTKNYIYLFGSLEMIGKNTKILCKQKITMNLKRILRNSRITIYIKKQTLLAKINIVYRKIRIDFVFIQLYNWRD